MPVLKYRTTPGGAWSLVNLKGKKGAAGTAYQGPEGDQGAPQHPWTLYWDSYNLTVPAGSYTTMEVTAGHTWVDKWTLCTAAYRGIGGRVRTVAIATSTATTITLAANNIGEADTCWIHYIIWGRRA